MTPTTTLQPEYLGHVGMVEQVEDVVKFSEPANAEELRKTASIVIKGSNRLILDECDRSLHDALCVVQSLIKKRYLIAGGGSAEAELTVKLGRWAQTLKGTDSYCAKAFAEALEIIPYTLAENAGMHPTMIVTELRKQHSEGKSSAGVDVKSRCISDMKELNILQPLLVNLSAISLATETVIMILKIDDIVPVM